MEINPRVKTLTVSLQKKELRNQLSKIFTIGVVKCNLKVNFNLKAAKLGIYSINL